MEVDRTEVVALKVGEEAGGAEAAARERGTAAGPEVVADWMVVKEVVARVAVVKDTEAVLETEVAVVVAEVEVERESLVVAEAKAAAEDNGG
eukprot:gene11165-13193_t